MSYTLPYRKGIFNRILCEFFASGMDFFSSSPFDSMFRRFAADECTMLIRFGRFVLSRLACSRRAASLRLGLETGPPCGPSVSHPRSGPSALLTDSSDASFCHAADWTHGRVAFTATRNTNIRACGPSWFVFLASLQAPLCVYPPRFLQPGLQGGLHILVAGLAQQGEHVLFIGLHAGLVEGIDLQQIAGQAAHILEEVDQIAHAVLADLG